MISLLLLLYTGLTRFPKPSTLKQRLAMIPIAGAPLAGDVTIHWNDHKIPFIEAARDEDVPVALGLVHAHLRLGQMEIMRRIAQGRIAEMGGPLLAAVDRAIRILELDRASPEIEAGLPADTRQWLAGFAAGINHYAAHMAEPPHEFRALGIAREPWTVRDLIAVGRLISIDVNWFDWLPMFKLRRRADWQHLWRRLLASGSTSLPSFREAARLKFLHRLLGIFNRSGSNSFVVSGRHSGTGSAIIASDPHVGLMLPNLWLIAGYKSPSHHAIGLMIPGVPVIAEGRNARVAWGGTNMHSASSDLYSVKKLDRSAFKTREMTVKARWWPSRRYVARDTDVGPIISDARILGAQKDEEIALRWVGHQPSDEFTALLRMTQARNWDDFRGAFASYAVSGMNMLYADIDGNIGQVLAVKLPVRKQSQPPDLVLDGADPDHRWDGYIETADLPHSYNPPEGYLVSANNRPVELNVPISYFFATNDRIHRISERLAEHGKISVAHAMNIQGDIFMPSAVELRDMFVDRLAESGIDGGHDPRARELIGLLKAWDGHYRAGSRGALAFELFFHHLSKQFYGPAFEVAKTATFASVGRIKALLEQDLVALSPEALTGHLEAAVKRAARRLARFETWGHMHRYGLSHGLGALPLLGRRYRFYEHAAPGSSDTVHKTAHGSSDRKHRVGYGAAARHVSDLSDMDNNWFALLGGQDGWLNSANFLDQLPLWIERAYVHVPMRIENVRVAFKHKTVLKAKAGPKPA